MYAISNKRMILLHLREVNDYDEELISPLTAEWALRPDNFTRQSGTPWRGKGWEKERMV